MWLLKVKGRVRCSGMMAVVGGQRLGFRRKAGEAPSLKSGLRFTERREET
jgi:hypothetical protein